jgi:predicted nucleic acid-binding protein
VILVLDASVAAKWFLPEPLSEEAAHLLEPRYDLVAPDLIRLEVASVLLKALRRGEVGLPEADEALGSLLPAAVRMFPAAERSREALEIARRHGGTVYDAAYIALALAFDAPLITNDAKLAAAAKKTKARVRLLADGAP